VLKIIAKGAQKNHLGCGKEAQDQRALHRQEKHPIQMGQNSQIADETKKQNLDCSS